MNARARWSATSAALLLLVSSTARAQDEEATLPTEPAAVGKADLTVEPRPFTLHRNLRFERITREQGLPQISVTSIAQDATGFVWLATGEGLVRFDGQRSRVFRHDPEDATSVSASAITKLLVSKDGTLWVGTQNGLNRYDPETLTFKRYMPSEGPTTLDSGVILALSEAADGKLWVGTGGGGVSVLDPATDAIQTYSGADRTVVTAVLPDRDGVVWLGTNQGLYRFEPAKKIFEPLFEEASVVISALAIDRERHLWIGTTGLGLHRYAIEKKKLDSYTANPDDRRTLADNGIKSIFEDHDGRIWVGTETALHLAVGGGVFERFSPAADDPRALPRPPVEAIYQDRAGVLWVGTYGGGAGILDPLALKFAFYRDFNGGLYERGDDLWVSSAEGVCRFRGKTALEGVCWDLGWSPKIFVDSRGTAWVTGSGANQGIYRLDAGTSDRWIHYTHDPKNPKSINPGMAGAFEDRAGNIWIAAFGSGLQRFDRAREEFLTEFQSPAAEIYVLEEDAKRDGLFWLGTANQGIVLFDRNTGEVKQFTPKKDDLENRTDNAVVAMVFDGDRHIWAATYGGGLKRLDRESGTFKTYRVADGLPSESVYSLLRDPAGYLWMSTVSGLARFDPKTEKFDVFTERDGLQSDEFFLMQALATRDGRFVFGGLNGFTALRPEEIDIDRFSPPVVVTGIRVMDEPYEPGTRADAIKNLSLAYDESQITIDLAALSFGGGRRTTFEYKLEGLNDRWFDLQSPSLVLNGLEDGDYTLWLRSRNRHGVESEPVGLSLVIAPPFWRSWWAYSLYGLSFLGVLFGVYRYQQTRIDRLQKMARLAAVEREFDLTATVQSWFLPETRRFNTGRSELVGFYRAADKCGGDWWWYERVNERKLLVIVADVTGHGVAPAMLTAAVAMGIGVQSDGELTDDKELLDRLARINREVLARCKGNQHMTMTALLLDEATGDIDIYGLGGLPAVLLDRSGNHRVLAPRGVPLGSAEPLNIGRQSARMAPGDRLVITTDGVIEAALPNGRQFGLRRFVRLVHEVRDLSIDQAVDRIVVEVDAARGRQMQDDDFTFCLVERQA